MILMCFTDTSPSLRGNCVNKKTDSNLKTKGIIVNEKKIFSDLYCNGVLS